MRRQLELARRVAHLEPSEFIVPRYFIDSHGEQWTSAQAMPGQLPRHALYRTLSPEQQMALPKWKAFLSLILRNGKCSISNRELAIKLSAWWAEIPYARRERFVAWFVKRPERTYNFSFRNLPIPGDSGVIERWPSLFLNTCSFCHTWMRLQEGRLSTRGTWACTRCFAQYGECAGCHHVRWRESLGDNRRRALPPNSEGLCAWCVEAIITNTIRAYSANPIALLIPEMKLDMKGLYQGVELEVEDASGNPFGSAQQLLPGLDKKAIIKRDGSLNNGFEICTIPLLLEEHRDYWQGVFSLPLWEGLSADNAGTAGLHIHISRAPLEKVHQARYVHFWSQPENRNFLETISGRMSNHYANYNCVPGAKFEEAQGKVQDEGWRGDKYDVVNCRHPHTLEIRAFQATKVYERMLQRLELTRALAEFCVARDHQHMQWPKFKEWLGEGKTALRFPELVKFAADFKVPAAFNALDDWKSRLPTDVRSEYERYSSCRCNSCNSARRYIEEGWWAPQTAIEANPPATNLRQGHR